MWILLGESLYYENISIGRRGLAAVAGRLFRGGRTPAEYPQLGALQEVEEVSSATDTFGFQVNKPFGSCDLGTTSSRLSSEIIRRHHLISSSIF